ncbi:MAG: hypothetical protein ACKOAU_04625 [Pirellula sp.]
MKDLWRAAIWILWGLWWGGLSFYAIVVVPIGTEQIGSVAQGFITQRVTQWHNLLCILMTLALAIEAYRTRNRFLWAACGTLGILTALLLAGHAFLTQQMDFRAGTVPANFYSQHSIYLWLTAAEWCVGLFLLWFFMREFRHR